MAISMDELYYKNLYVNSTQTQSIRTQNQNNQTQAAKTAQDIQATQTTQQSVNNGSEANTGVRLTLSQEAQQLRDRMRTIESSGNQNNYRETGASTQNTSNLQSYTSSQVGYTPPPAKTNTVPELPVNEVQTQNQEEYQTSTQNSQQATSRNVQMANQNQIQQYQYALAATGNPQSASVMDLFR